MNSKKYQKEKEEEMKAIKLLLLCRADYCKISTEDINEAIAEVEAMQERIKEIETPKTCDGCNSYDAKNGYCNDGARYVPETFYCKWHEPKDNS